MSKSDWSQAAGTRVQRAGYTVHSAEYRAHWGRVLLSAGCGLQGTMCTARDAGYSVHGAGYRSKCPEDVVYRAL